MNKNNIEMVAATLTAGILSHKAQHSAQGSDLLFVRYAAKLYREVLEELSSPSET